MQFRGHPLPVHQSMSVPWGFFSSSHFISQFPPTRFPLITAIRMCHHLPVHHLGMAFLVGSKKYNTTIMKQFVYYVSEKNTHLISGSLTLGISVRGTDQAYHMTSSQTYEMLNFVNSSLILLLDLLITSFFVSL